MRRKYAKPRHCWISNRLQTCNILQEFRASYYYIGLMVPPKTVPDRRDRNLILWLILAVALIVRIVYLLQYEQSGLWEQLTVDNWYHHNWAGSLADGNISGDTTYFRAPFYVYCLGLLYAVLGSSLWTARLFGMAVGLASVGLTYLLGRKLVDRRTGLIAAGIHALYPWAVYFEGELLLDSLFLLLVQVTIYRLLIWLDSGQARDLLWTGLAAGVAALTRPTVLVVIPIVLVWIFLRSGTGSRLKQIVMFLAGLAITIGPVFVRNVIVADDPVLISSQGGINLYIGNNDRADGFSAAMPEPLGHNWDIAQITWLAEDDTGREMKPGEVSDYWRDRALDWITDNPGRFAGLYLQKLYYQIGDLEISNNRSLRAASDVITFLRINPLRFGLIFALAVLGIGAAWKRTRGMRLVLAFAGLYIFAVSLFFFNSRFRLPLLPVYFVLAAAGIGLLRDQLRARSSKVLLSLVLAIVAGALSFSTVYTVPYSASPQAALASGHAAYRHHDYTAALAHFREARRIDPQFPEVNLNIGACFFRMGRPDSARFYFEREKELHPGRVKAYQNLASFELVRGDYAEAQRYARKAVAKTPYDVTSNILLVRALGPDTTISISHLSDEMAAAARRTDDDLFLLNEIAAVFSRRGNLGSAERFSQRALEAVPPPVETDPQAFRPDFRNAREPFQRKKARAWHLLSYIAGVRGQLNEAVRCSQRALELDPDLAEAYLNLVTALQSAGRLSEADSVLSEVRARFPDSLLQRLMPGSGNPRQ